MQWYKYHNTTSESNRVSWNYLKKKREPKNKINITITICIDTSVSSIPNWIWSSFFVVVVGVSDTVHGEHTKNKIVREKIRIKSNRKAGINCFFGQFDCVCVCYGAALTNSRQNRQTPTDIRTKKKNRIKRLNFPGDRRSVQCNAEKREQQ